MLSKTKSIRPKKNLLAVSSVKDENDDDFARDSEDSDDYDGVPKTEEV